jgi:sulfonate transport system substrate-binding protein
MSQDKPQGKKLNRRDFLKTTGGVGAAACLTLSGWPGGSALAKQPDKFTPWGWPTPYEKVSEKSLKWLDSRGWLPLSKRFSAWTRAKTSQHSYPVALSQKLSPAAC